ncbi:MAG: long-chain-fatty-acid--CoA ligase [Phycisphaerae bacterium]|nr:long-chain-fatty-acid--CoA ligase [Phycisphaerae bacterium]
MQLLKSIYRSWRKNLLNEIIVDDFRAWKGVHLQVASWHVRKKLEQTTDNQKVAILLPTSGLFPVALTAIWGSGRTAVPLNYLLSPEEIQYIIKDSGVDTVITATPMLDFIGEVPEGVELIKLDKMKFGGIPPIQKIKPMEKDALAVLLYTSGTSGKPKGVMLSAENLQSNIEQCTERASFSKSDVFIGLLPQFHSFGFTVTTLLPSVLGAKTVYIARFNPRKVISVLEEHKPSIMLAIPSMYNAILHTKTATKEHFASVRLAGSGGEALPDAVFDGFNERFNVWICEGYGLTETSPVTNWSLPEEKQRGTVGRPVVHLEQVIVDEEENHLGPGEDGEIRMRGPNIMQGYYNLQEETDAVFDKGGFFKTGDMGQLDEKGYLKITGRIKEMLIIGGENVFPREIEEALTEHPAVSAAGVVGRKDPSRGEVPVAFVELIEGETFDEASLRAWCREKVAQFKVPKNIYHLEELPRNPTGKILRRALTELVLEDSLN